jgi:flagellin-like protein
MGIKEKEAVSPVIGVILMVAITVVLAAVLYVWITAFMAPTPATPRISLGAPTVNLSAQTVTWPVISVSIATALWTDCTGSIAVNGIPTTATFEVLYDGSVSTFDAATGVYISGGQVVRVTFAAGTISDGDVLDLTIRYDPSGETAGVAKATA